MRVRADLFKCLISLPSVIVCIIIDRLYGLRVYVWRILGWNKWGGTVRICWAVAFSLADQVTNTSLVIVARSQEVRRVVVY